MSSAAMLKRARLRSISAYQLRTTRPKVVGLGVDAVGAADDGGVLELDGAALEHSEQTDKAGTEQRGCFLYLEGLRRVHDVVGGEAVVEPTGLLCEALSFEAFGNGGGEGDDVVLDLGLDFSDTGGGDAGLGGDVRRRRRRG